MESLIKSRDVQDAIRRESIRGKVSMLEAERRAIGYLNEIVSDYSYSAIRFADMALTRLWTQLYDGVEVHNFSTVRELAKDYEIIYTPCHRSHIDYLLLSYVIYRRGLMVPYIAAGDNLNLPFVGQLYVAAVHFLFVVRSVAMHFIRLYLKNTYIVFCRVIPRLNILLKGVARVLVAYFRPKQACWP
jgi:glycerol-3-phosphate O-acyltransferase